MKTNCLLEEGNSALTQAPAQPCRSFVRSGTLILIRINTDIPTNQAEKMKVFLRMNLPLQEGKELL